MLDYRHVWIGDKNTYKDTAQHLKNTDTLISLQLHSSWISSTHVHGLHLLRLRHKSKDHVTHNKSYTELSPYTDASAS